MVMRALAQRLSPGGAQGTLSIFIFHRVRPVPDPLFPNEPDVRRFAQMMGWLQRWFNVLPLEQALQQLQTASLPPRAAAITFDDGYADNASQALPVLRHYGLCATFFVSTGFLDGGRMWNDSVIEAIRCTGRRVLDLRHLGLGRWPVVHLAERRAAIAALLERLKYQEPEQRQQNVAGVLAAAQAVAPRNLMLRSAQLRLLRDSGMQIGAHTVSHPILQSSSDAQARWEIGHGKAVLEALLGQPVPLFAYPNGKPETDFSPRHMAMVQEAGFVGAVSTAAGVAGPGTHPFALPRFTPWDRSALRFGLRVLGNMRRGAAACDGDAR